MKNKQLALSIIRSDCKLQDFYVSNCGKKTCAIGALALAAGISRKQLREGDGEDDGRNGSSIRSRRDLRLAIVGRFDLNVGQLDRIQQINDETEDHHERVAKILEYLKSL